MSYAGSKRFQGGGSHFFSRVLVIVHVPPLPPLEHFEEAETGFEEPIMLEDHLVEGIERQIPAGVSMFESSDGCVKAVGLIPKGRLLGGYHFRSMLSKGKHNAQS